MKTNSIKSVTMLSLCAAVTVLFAGCAQELRDEMVRQEQTINTEINRVQDRTLTTENRLEEISNLFIKMNNNMNETNQVIFEKLDSINARMRDLDAMENRINTLSQQLTELDKEQSKKLKVILDEVLKENQRIVQRIRMIEKDVYGEATQPTVEAEPQKKGLDTLFGGGSSANQEYVRHQVKSGENLWSIGQNYGVSMEAIAEANKMESISDIIKPGQVLLIPVKKQ